MTVTNGFFEFTRQAVGHLSQAGMVLHVSLIKSLEQAPNGCARVILFEEFEGHDYYWTVETYDVLRKRLRMANNDIPVSRPGSGRESRAWDQAASLGS